MHPTQFLELLCASTRLAARDAAENKMDTNHCPYRADVSVEGQAINKKNKYTDKVG